MIQTRQNLVEFFGADGPLAECLHGFAPRPEQLAMAEEVANAIHGGHNLVIEAGTGTGKTLAYLVPALLSGQRVIISTGTRTLQDQLFHRDLPMIGKALGRPAVVRLLKGRANYLCLYRLDQLQHEADRKQPKKLFEDITRLRQWAGRTRTGDVSEVTGILEDSPIWPRVTSTVDNCLGSRCLWFDDCHVAAARQEARDAEMVVVNHHLLMADLTIKEEGFGELLPGADAVVVDEAQNFPEVAQGFFNTSLGSGQVQDLIGDVRAEALNAGFFDSDLDRTLDAVRLAANDAKLALASAESSVGWAEAGTAFAAAFNHIGECCEALYEQMSAFHEAGAGLLRCRDRVSSMMTTVEQISDTDDETGLRWIRQGSRSFTANLTPLDASGEIKSLLEARPCTWIFTSATLAVGDEFAHFTDRLGISAIATRQIPSPFAFPEISRLYLPAGLPGPNQPDFTDCAVAAMLEVVRISAGRAFLLFTSHRALRRAAEILEDDSSFEFPLLVQGTAPRSRLLEQFARLGNAVLLGTATFWEGVDIRGSDLVLVAIDRLPFASPGDPMLAARLESIRNKGGNPFRDYQLPQAVLSLKQGVGRLIRDYDDYGVVMICDPRVGEKSYGRTFLQNLPAMPVTSDLDEIRGFFSVRQQSDA
ncbi:MAG: ATP-dependent DNA helicase [Gammaproteobacteria bacterium]|nr:ATP-dependent DNA helicase [Gammaproteobacteria bacterium]